MIREHNTLQSLNFSHQTEPKVIEKIKLCRQQHLQTIKIFSVHSNKYNKASAEKNCINEYVWDIFKVHLQKSLTRIYSLLARLRKKLD